MPSLSASSISHFTEDLKNVCCSTSSIVDLETVVKEDTILPPVDGGRRAWTFLFGAFMIEGLLYGKSFVHFHISLIDKAPQASL
jgi:hypothetical protein